MVAEKYGLACPFEGTREIGGSGRCSTCHRSQGMMLFKSMLYISQYIQKMIKFLCLLLYTVQSLYNAIFGFIRMNCIISELCYKGTILKFLQRNYRKMTIKWSFS